MTQPATTNPRTRIKHHSERAVPQEAAAILEQGLVAHVGIVEDGCPVVIPMSYHYDTVNPDKLYIHGSVKSRLLRSLSQGGPVCVTVTLSDGLIYSRKAMNHSMNYRSVIAFGQAREVTSLPEKFQLFDQMVRRYFQDRTPDQDYRSPPEQDLAATALVEVTISQWSAKARRGGPTGPEDDDPGAPGSAGIIDLREF